MDQKRLVQPQQADEGRRDAPPVQHKPGDRAYRVPTRGFELVNRLNADAWYNVKSGAMGPGTLSAVITLEWLTPNHIIELSGCTLGDGTPAGMASVGVQIRNQATNEEVFQSGTAATFVPFADLFGLEGCRTMPAARRVNVNDKWVITFNNAHAANTYTASLTFAARRIAVVNDEGEC